MKIIFAGTVLADYSTFPPCGVRINGQPVFEAIEIVRAAQKTFRYRGNDSVQLTFSVTQTFASLKLAEVFLMTNPTSVPKSGLCTVNCGASDADMTPVYLANAILAAVPGQYEGSAVTMNYTIVAPAAVLTTPIGYITGGGSVVVLQGTPAIASGATYVDVVFSTPFTVAPSVTEAVMKPMGGVNILSTLRNITATGFSVDFVAPVPATGYLLSWIAAGT